MNTQEIVDKVTKDLTYVDKDALIKSINTIGIFPTSRKWGSKTDSYDNMMVAGRLFMIYSSNNFAKSISEYVQKLSHRVHPNIIEFMLKHEDVLNQEINSRQDMDMDVDWMAAGTYVKTYFAKANINDDPIESMQYLWMRVAVQLWYDKGLDEVIRCYRELSDKYYIHATPTLFNAGMVRYYNKPCDNCDRCLHKNKLDCLTPITTMEPRNQMSSCFLVTVGDNTNDILNKLKACGLISKNKGGIGIDVSLLRHSEIGDVGYSKGTTPFIYLVNAVVRYFDQEGIRKGAATIYTRSHHIDIIEFCEMTLKTGDKYSRAHQINTAIWFSTLFSQREEEDGMWTLFCPNKTRDLNYLDGIEFNKRYIEYENEFLSNPKMKQYYKRIKARDFLKHITDCQSASGMPYMLDGDACNFKSNQKNLGYIRSGNLCLEIIQYSSEDEISSCNLLSISMRAFVKGKSGNLKDDYDWKKLCKIVHNSVKNVNQVIDKNYCPLPEIEKSNKLHRPIGIGVTGFNEAIKGMDLHFEHPLTRTFNKMFFACLYFNALCESVNEALKYGPYESFKGSPISEGKFQFNLWADEYKLLRDNNLLGKKPLRTPEDDKPLDPNEWNQDSIYLNNGDIIQPSWESLRRCIMKYGIRNSLLIALMPSATTANIMRNTETTEAPMTNLFDRRLMNGNYPIIDRYLEMDCRDIGIWNKYTLDLIIADYGSISKLDKFIKQYPEFYPQFNGDWNRLQYIQLKYKTMWELKTKLFMILSSERARYICQSQSFNIYMQEPNYKKLRKSFHTSMKLGLKTCMYYLRSTPPRGASHISIDNRILKFVDELNPKSIINMVKKSDKKSDVIIKIPKVNSNPNDKILMNINYIKDNIDNMKNKDKMIDLLNQLNNLISDESELLVCDKDGECLSCN